MTRPVLAAFCLAFAMPLAAQQTMPPAPFAYRQLEDPAQEAAAHGLHPRRHLDPHYLKT